jgi:RNA polymerase sigma-70 factor (ECF subfamily)
MQLPEKLRLAVTLHYIDGFSMRETAQILHCPEGTVKQRLHRARTTLRILLEEEV